MPHETISSSELHRHIDVDQSEPIRMRQLLIWCAKRASASVAIPNNPEVNQKFEKIKEGIVQGLVDKKINTSWYQRGSKEVNSQSKKPNPRNLETAAKKAEQEKQLERLLAEERKLKSLLEKRQARPKLTGPLRITQAEGEAYLTEADKKLLDELTPKHSVAELEHKVKAIKYQAYEQEYQAMAIQNEVELSKPQCDRLFKLWADAFEKDRQTLQRAVEPISLLRLLPPTET
ncbi:hypothetical protein HDU96_003061 [Phlyctochytrium bullatum]|nr:hypothetical protein HDU96_003061 [Phlyctochytrium bullatum]